MKKGSKINIIIIGIIVILCLTAVVIGVVKNSNISKTTKESGKREWKIKEIHDRGVILNGNFHVAKWEDATITEKFYNFEYQGIQYNRSEETKIQSNKIGNKLEEITLTGTDIYTNTDYNIEASLYEITNLKKECVVAVQFKDDTNYYVYVNNQYIPEKLENLVEDLQLKNTISFGTVHYNYWDVDSKGDKEYQEIEFYDVNNEVIWNMLFEDMNKENIYGKVDSYTGGAQTNKFGISIDIPLLGIRNKIITLTDNGYLVTNLFWNDNAFYIGEDKVQKFINYIIDNYDGYKLVYVDEEEIRDEKVMVTENTANGFVTKEVEITNHGTNTVEPYIPVE